MEEGGPGDMGINAAHNNMDRIGSYIVSEPDSTDHQASNNLNVFNMNAAA